MSTFPKHMMATKATHKTGDLSRDSEQLCIVNKQDPETGEYVGNWMFGFGFFGVRFDPQTTRDLTPQEIAHFEQRNYGINNTDYGQMKMAGYDHVERPESPKLSDVEEQVERQSAEAPAPSSPGDDIEI